MKKKLALYIATIGIASLTMFTSAKESPKKAILKEDNKSGKNMGLKMELKALKEDFDKSLRSQYDKMLLAETGLSFPTFHDAMVQFNDLKSKNLITGKNLLTIADMDKSSSVKRFYVLDLDAEKVLFHTHVSHGKGSGMEYANTFSNIVNSEMTSIGMYLTSNTYNGKNGFSLKLDGMDIGYNDKARKRGIVVHGAAYASPSFISNTGRLGRSQGCPALPLQNYREIINTISNGTALYINSEDKQYEQLVIWPKKDDYINELYKSLGEFQGLQSQDV